MVVNLLEVSVKEITISASLSQPSTGLRHGPPTAVPRVDSLISFIAAELAHQDQTPGTRPHPPPFVCISARCVPQSVSRKHSCDSAGKEGIIDAGDLYDHDRDARRAPES